MLHILFATYIAILLAEIVGDKLLYTTGALATRYRVTPIVCGLLLAFAAKMGVAVIAGAAISRFPPRIVAAITVVNFLVIAFVLWRGPDKDAPEERRSVSRGLAISFAAAFFSEWGDAGQMMAATMALRFGAPVLVWLGAVSAMITKGLLAAYFGGRIRDWIQRYLSPGALRYGAVCIILLFGIVSAVKMISD